MRSAGTCVISGSARGSCRAHRAGRRWLSGFTRHPPPQSCFVPFLRVDGDVCTHAKWPFPVQPTLNDLAGLSSPFRDRHSCHSCSLTEELKGSFPEGIQVFAVGVPVCAAGRVSGQVVWRGALAGVCGQPPAGPLLPAWRWFSPLPLLT